ncbi:MAG: undecaprenyldiphospho-muramoylpentapeptide beta-N-acetylglucosaminyltransferase [Rhodospirillaceae bacterium]|nr:undecaprenyldiphospho-muramoylpentapeptide beta-N-acetylglucosaminyltransferase [Rhodospirillaceae bacterium]|tara:strand:+ start:81192 stop:82322 length:1131 start_codon:yes stop_codon:yes gene_type:complete
MSAITRSRPIVLAAGGTGGHVYPALALADVLGKRGWPIAFVTDERGTAFGDKQQGTEVHHIKAASLGGGACSKLKGLTQLGVGLLQARALLKRVQPAVAVGFGGYPSVPSMCAATQIGIPTVIHEQNAVLGRANRLLASRVGTIATSFNRVAGIQPQAAYKTVMTGNPVRHQISAIGEQPYPAPAPNDAFNLLVFGGSQGARVLSDVVPAALAKLTEEQRSRLHVTQQCRPEDLESVESVYARANITTVLKTYFDDMPDRLSETHLVVGRAGASTIAELMAARRPAILVPYLHAMDDHQTANAAAIADTGASWSIPEPSFTVELIAAKFTDFMNSPEKLAEAAANTDDHRRPDAADQLADAVEAAANPVAEQGAAA